MPPSTWSRSRPTRRLPRSSSGTTTRTTRTARRTSRRPRPRSLRRSPTGSYYWDVIPVDAEGNRGVSTPVTIFSWAWPSVTTPTVDRPGRRRRGLRPEVLLGPRSRRGALRGRDQLLRRLRAPARRFAATVADRSRRRSRRRRSSRTTRTTGESARSTRTATPASGTSARLPEDVRQRSARHGAERQEPAHARQPERPGRPTSDGSHGRVSDQCPDHDLGPGPGASSYEVDVTPVPVGTLVTGARSFDHHWRRLHRRERLDAARLRLDGDQPYPDADDVANESRSTSPSAQYCARVQARTDRDTATRRRLRRLHLPRRRARARHRVRVHRPPGRPSLPALHPTTRAPATT